MTVSLPDGEYKYKFRNGYSTDWDDVAAPWEDHSVPPTPFNSTELATGGCAFGNHSDRHLVVPPLYGDNVYGPFCWGACFACSSPSHPVFPPPPPAVAAPGWFPSNETQTCDYTCAEVNLNCTSIAQAAHSDETDTCEEVEALIESCCRRPAGTCAAEDTTPHFNTGINDHFHPGWNTAFNSWSVLDASGTFDVTSVPAQFECSYPNSPTWPHKRRLCYCHYPTEYVNYHCLSSAGPSIITSSGVFYGTSPRWTTSDVYYTHPADGETGIFDINLDMLSTGGSVSCARFTGTYLHAGPGSGLSQMDGCEVSLFHLSDDYPNGTLIQASVVNHNGQPNVSTVSFDHDIPAGVRALRFHITPRTNSNSDWCQLVKPCLHSCSPSDDHTFSYTGSSQIYETGGATSFNVSLWGAGGGRGAMGGSQQQGGPGGYTSAIIHVPDGTSTLEVIVGGAGERGTAGQETSNAFGGGGSANQESAQNGGGGGGGRSALRLPSGEEQITAGGGGGGGYCTSCIGSMRGGAGGGLVGGDGGDSDDGTGIAGLGGRTTLSAGPTAGWPGLYDDALCRDTCAYPADGYCDDGGAGSEFSVCIHGTDCTDCGSRSQPAWLSVNAGGRGGQGAKRIGDNGTQFTGGNAGVAGDGCIVQAGYNGCTGWGAGGGGGGYYGGGAGGAKQEFHGGGGGGSGYAALGSTKVDMRNGTMLPEGPGTYPSAGTEESNGLVIIRRYTAPPPPPPRPPVNPPPPRAPWHHDCYPNVTLDKGIQLHYRTRCGFTRLVRININGEHACGVRGDEAMSQLLTYCDEMCRIPYPPIARKTINYRATGMLTPRTLHTYEPEDRGPSNSGGMSCTPFTAPPPPATHPSFPPLARAL